MQTLFFENRFVYYQSGNTERSKTVQKIKEESKKGSQELLDEYKDILEPPEEAKNVPEGTRE